MKITYRISELVPYINWVYYYFAWQVKEEAEKQRMHAEALAKRMADRLEFVTSRETFNGGVDKLPADAVDAIKAVIDALK